MTLWDEVKDGVLILGLALAFTAAIIAPVVALAVIFGEEARPAPIQITTPDGATIPCAFYSGDREAALSCDWSRSDRVSP